MFTTARSYAHALRIEAANLTHQDRDVALVSLATGTVLLAAIAGVTWGVTGLTRIGRKTS